MAPSGPSPMRTQYGVKAASGLQFELPSFSFGSESIVAGTSIPAPEREANLPPASRPQLHTAITNSSDNGQSPDPLRSHPTTPGNGTPTGPPAKDVTSNGAGPTSTPRSVATSTAPSQSQTSNVQTSISSSMSPPAKRPNHVRKLLSFRSLSNSFSSHGRSDSQMSGMTQGSNSDFRGPSRSQTPSIFGRTSSVAYDRPGTSGGQSVAGSTATGKPSLRKRVSGAFWSRRNSLMLSNMIDENGEENAMEIGHTPGSEPRSPAAKRQKPLTPAPQLPEIGNLKVSKGLKDSDDGFLNSKDLFSGVRYKREVSAEEVAAMKKKRREN